MNEISTSRPKPPAPITVTPAAATRIREIIGKATKPVLGVRVSVKARGCSGMAYVIEYAEQRGKFEDAIDIGGATVFVDPKAVMYLLGSEMDYQEGKMESGFSFKNPNEKGRCGCGESFSI